MKLMYQSLLFTILVGAAIIEFSSLQAQTERAYSQKLAPRVGKKKPLGRAIGYAPKKRKSPSQLGKNVSRAQSTKRSARIAASQDYLDDVDIEGAWASQDDSFEAEGFEVEYE